MSATTAHPCPCLHHAWYVIICRPHSMHTVDNKASKIPNLRVHIAPVGYEIDRIILPAREMRADKVVLLVHDKPNEDRAVQFYEKISLALEESGVEVTKEYHDRLICSR